MKTWNYTCSWSGVSETTDDTAAGVSAVSVSTEFETVTVSMGPTVGEEISFSEDSVSSSIDGHVVPAGTLFSRSLSAFRANCLMYDSHTKNKLKNGK